MGYERHHAIIVTSFDVELLQQAHTLASAFGMAVTPIIAGAVNFYGTFLVGPDGSKEGWEGSGRGDEQRTEFVDWLKTKVHGDGSSNLDWVEVQYGDDDGNTRIVNDSDEYYRAGTWTGPEDAA